MARHLGWTAETLDAVRAARHVVVSLDAPVGTTDVDLGSLIAATTGHPFEEIDDGALTSLLGALDPRERQVLTLRLGLDGDEPQPGSRSRGA